MQAPPAACARQVIGGILRDGLWLRRQAILRVCDASNTISAGSDRHASDDRDYRARFVLEIGHESIGRLLVTLNQTPPEESEALARINATVPAKPAYDTIERKSPPPLDGNGRGYFGKL